MEIRPFLSFKPQYVKKKAFNNSPFLVYQHQGILNY